jgi:hypothetical protein
MKVCTVEGCERDAGHKASGRRGYCQAHYKRLAKYDGPVANEPIRSRPKPVHGTCTVEGCGRAAHTRGWCHRHYARWYKHGDPTAGGRDRVVRKRAAAECLVDGCGRGTHAQDLCQSHYRKLRKYGDPLADRRPRAGTCSVDGCSNPHSARGWCASHYARWRKYGNPRGLPKRPRKGWITDKGYRLIWRPEHPNRDKRGYVPEHVVIVSEYVGRPLLPNETVHHRNGIRDDNRLENLELWASAHPPGQRVVDLVSFANSIIKRYGDDPTVYP